TKVLVAGEPSQRYRMRIVSRAGSEFQPLPLIVISLVIRPGSAFADGKADVVAAVNWFFGQPGVRHTGEGLAYRRIPASRVAWADGVH
ncbi:MAG TPA: hypothetical protein VF772_07860, partial [Terriglobales bacterium]